MDMQNTVVTIGIAAFGANNMVNRRERALRFLEEALELAQSTGLSAEDVETVKTYVFSRPVEPHVGKELGGTLVTLFALADAHKSDLLSDGWIEIRRVAGRLQAADEKHKNKPDAIKAA